MRGWQCLVAAVMVLGASVVAAQGHPVLVELFTSEGCSSCPPADALLRSIAGRETGSGQMVVGISEHVTYWNRLGWADPFSAERYTERQEAYRARFGLESAYTPQVVVNGEREVLGSDRSAVLRAVQETDHAGRAGAASVHIVSAIPVGDKMRVVYAVRVDKSRGEDVYAAVTQDAATSHVERGENSGRTLTHVSVARSLTLLGAAWGEEGRTVDVPAGTGSGARHVVLFVQRAGPGPVTAVDVAPVAAALENARR